MYILCDIGATKTRLALGDSESLTTSPVIYNTPERYDEGLDRMKEEVTKLLSKERDSGKNQTADGMVIGIAGILMENNSGVYDSPNLPDWNKKPIRSSLEKHFNTRVYIENDTALVALGEAHYGAGKGASIMAYITVSTGVGGMRIVNGAFDEHALGFEPGHQIIVDPESRTNAHVTCASCNVNGHLEALIGGKALQRKYGKPPSQITDEKVWDEAAKHLAYGLNNTIVYWSPDIVVLGGGLIVHERIKIDKVKVYLERIMKIYPGIPPVVACRLGDVGGLYGGIAYINTRGGR